MPLLTITNLRTSPISIQDPTGESTLSFLVPGSGALTDMVIGSEELISIEPQLIAMAMASHLTWTVSDDPTSSTDVFPLHEVTVLTSPYNAVAGDQIILTALSAPGVVSVVLSAAARVGHAVQVIDKTGDAESNNVTITVASAGTINGAASLVLNVNKGWVFLLKTGTNAWLAVSSAVVSIAAAGGDLTGNYPNPTVAALAITAAKMAVGAISADVTGRALFAAGVFDIATIDSAVAAGAIGEDRLTATELNARVVAVAADATEGGVTTNQEGIPVVLEIDIPDAATATLVYKTTRKIEIIDVTVRKDGAGAANTIQLTDSADVAITDAIVAAVDKALTRAGTIDVTKAVVTAGGTFKIVATRAAGTMAAHVRVHCILRA